MRKKTVLVIDDDEMNLQIAKMILEKRLPCEVIGADNGVEGIDILKSQRVSLVLLDVMMPDFDGIETLQEIRGDAQIKGVPVMMLTASVDVETVQKAGELGVKDYIRKPFLPADLIERVQRKLAEIHSEEILLLGDNESVLKSMQSIIEDNFPHEALIATTTTAAEKILHESDIDLIIACADMKFIDGFRFLSLVASEEKFSDKPFAITTPDKIREFIEKLSSPGIIEEPPIEETSAKAEEPPVEEKIEEEPPAVMKIAESVIVRPKKSKIANVVTNLIGYQKIT